jgi:GNAT superfamily N-acetyltransferase
MDFETIRVIATSVLRETVCCFDDRDLVIVEAGRLGVRVAYTSTRASHDDGEVTRLECRVDVQGSQMWVDDLWVASSLRSGGIGRQLAAAAERFAMSLDLKTVNVFPLAAAGQFWKKVGYTSHPKAARVLTKDLLRDHSALPVERETSLRSTTS